MTHEKNMIEYLDFAEDECTWKFPTAELEKIFRKKNFNKSQPKLGDFIPTDEDGEPGKKMQYQSALDRRLWDGWEIKRGELSYPNEIAVLPDIQITYSNHIGERFFKHKTYESLINSGVKLERIQRK